MDKPKCTQSRYMIAFFDSKVHTTIATYVCKNVRPNTEHAHTLYAYQNNVLDVCPYLSYFFFNLTAQRTWNTAGHHGYIYIHEVAPTEIESFAITEVSPLMHPRGPQSTTIL